MMKPKQYDWKDSNMALFGSDTEKKLKKESAEAEPAWEGAGSEEGLKIWRINKFQVEEWPKENYGDFYSGDSYIILNTYKDPEGDELLHDVHFWIGKYSTQDEYGTAAYKTVELDTFLDDKPVQHREVMGNESKMFKSYFDTITLLKGGADTGFRRVIPESPKTRLLHFKGTTPKDIVVKEISPKQGNLNSDDVFIIDTFFELYQYNGENADKDEKFRAVQYVQQLKDERGGKVKESEILEEGSTSKSHKAIKSLKEGASKAKEPAEKAPPCIVKVSDVEGKMETTEMMTGSLDRGVLTDDDVFIINSGDEFFVYIGSGASIDERKNCLSYACNFANTQVNPYSHITVIAQGKETKDFNAIW